MPPTDHSHTPATSFPRSNGAPNLVTLDRLRSQPRTRLATGRARRLMSRPGCTATS
jgi:hypothetical protein